MSVDNNYNRPNISSHINLVIMNKIESLPKHIEYKSFDYDLRMHITAWGKICLCYHSYKAKEMVIFAQVIESEPIHAYKSTSVPEDIIDVFDFETAVNILEQRINDAVKTEIIKV